MKECRRCNRCYDDVAELCPDDGDRLRQGIPGGRIVGGRYRIDRVLGSGGMGTVYGALHVGLQRAFALKVIKSNRDPYFLEQFRVEAVALGKLKHPHIVDVTDYGIDSREGGIAYLVMELLRGRTLAQQCALSGPLRLERFLPLLQQIAAAIDYGHENGILHGDLKPANVFLCDGAGQQPSVKILDFGLARFVSSPSQQPETPPASRHPMPIDRPGTGATTVAWAPEDHPRFAGTPAYMAPELFVGQPSTVRTDLYALGALIYETVTGKLPFDSIEAATGPRAMPPPPSGLAEWIAKDVDDGLVAALRREPSARPGSAAALVGGVQTGLEAAARRGWRRRELPRRTAAAILLSVAVALIFSFLSRTPPLQKMEAMLVDLRFLALRPQAADPRILLLSLDDSTLAADPTPLTGKADEFSRQLERIFQAGARSVAVDLLLPAQWSTSEAFSTLVLHRANALTLAAMSTANGDVVGPECLNRLTAGALGPERFSSLFAFVNVEEDADGVTRRGYYGFEDRSSSSRPAFAAKAALLAAGPEAAAVKQSGRFWIDWSVDSRTFGRLSWREVNRVLEDRPQLFRDRLVIVGGEFSGSGDEIHASPRNAAPVSGLVLQSMMADTLLKGAIIRGVPVLYAYLCFVCLSALAAFTIIYRASYRTAILFSVATFALSMACGFALFLTHRVLTPLFDPAMSLIVSCALAFLIRSKFPAYRASL